MFTETKILLSKHIPIIVNTKNLKTLLKWSLNFYMAVYYVFGIIRNMVLNPEGKMSLFKPLFCM